MNQPKPREISVVIGSYLDKQTNQSKRVYRKIGTEIVSQKGVFLKIDAAYLSPTLPRGEDGTILLALQDAYDPNRQQGQQAGYSQAGQAAAAATRPIATPATAAPFDDEIPF